MKGDISIIPKFQCLVTKVELLALQLDYKFGSAIKPNTIKILRCCIHRITIFSDESEGKLFIQYGGFCKSLL